MSMNVSAVDGFESAVATVAFVDLAGFSAITDVYGDASAIAVLGHFEELVRQALGGLGPPIKWIGDEAMFGFPDPDTALQVLGRLLPACRSLNARRTCVARSMEGLAACSRERRQ